MLRIVHTFIVVAALAGAACSRDAVAASLRHIERGDRYAQQGQYKEASIEFRNAIKRMPDSIEAHTKLADVAARLSDTSTVLSEQLRLAELKPDDLAAQVRAGTVYLQAGRFADARDRAGAALRLNRSDASAHVLLGRALAGLDDPVRSEASLREAVRLAPSSSEGHLALGGYLWSIGRLGDAEVELRRAVDVDPNDASADRTLALFWMASGRAPDAEPHWKNVSNSPGGDRFALADYYVSQGRLVDADRELRSLVSSPEHADAARLRLSGVVSAQGDRQAAYALLDAVLAHDGRNAAALVQRARLLLSELRFDDAFAVAEAARAADPASADAAFLEGQIHAAKGAPELAVQMLQTALRLNPKAGPAATAIAEIRLTGGHTEEAIEWAERARMADPRDLQARLMLIRALTKAGHLARAEEEARASVTMWPRAAVAEAQLGAVQLAGRNAAESERAFEKALTLDSRSAAVLLVAAQAYASAGALDKAERVLKQALDIDPSELRALNLLGQLHLRQGRLDAAREEFARVAAQASDPVGASTMVAMILQAQNRPAEARREYERILAAHPTAGVAANNLACMELDEHRLDEALRYALIAKKQLNRAPEVNDTLGWIYFQRGQVADAVRPLADSVEAQPDNALFRFHLAMAYWKNGSVEKAREELARAVATSASFAGRDEALRVKQQLDLESARRTAQNTRR